MKIGIRKPSPNKSLAARTSVARVVRHNLGLKAPRGWGWATNPRKAAYNRIYNRTTFSTRKGGIEALIAFLIFGLVFFVLKILLTIIWDIVSSIVAAFRKKKPIETPEQKQDDDLQIQHGIIPQCPRCSSNMMLRTAKRGSNKGGKFWGCTKFPRCRATLIFQVHAE